MREIIKSGATTILVSHSLYHVRSLCNKVLWLDHGRQIAFTDDVAGVCDSYETYLRDGKAPVFDPVAIRVAREAERARQESERRRVAEANARAKAAAERQAAELVALRAEAVKLNKVRAILSSAKTKAGN